MATLPNLPRAKGDGADRAAVPRATPPEAQARIAETVARVRALPEVRARLQADGCLPLDLDGPGLPAHMAAESARQRALFARLGVRPE